MSGFSAEWLALREPFDAAARAPELVAKLRSCLRLGTASVPLEVVDLGAGAGSNLRYLAPRLGGVQRWRLIDHDTALLDAAVAETREWARKHGVVSEPRAAGLALHGNGFECEMNCEQRDLRRLESLALPSDGLVTAAALLDLVSSAWLGELARRCAAARAAVHFALSYDGRTHYSPEEPEDPRVLELFNRHQHSEKSFGPALGPDAVNVAMRALRDIGYELATATSDWHIPPSGTAMQLALLQGYFAAATELAPERSAELARWHAHRVDHVTAGSSTLTVGHLDLVGRLRMPTGRPW